jgi:hypothetical protein
LTNNSKEYFNWDIFNGSVPLKWIIPTGLSLVFLLIKDNTFNYLPFLDLTAFLNKIGLLLILTFLMAGCSQGVREVVKTTGSVAIVGSAISPTGGVIAGATTYIMELMDYDRNSEVPTIKTPEQAIVELGDRLLIFIFLEYITVDFQISMKRSTRRKCCRCGCKRLIEFLEPSHISQLGYIQWQCATKMD